MEVRYVGGRLQTAGAAFCGTGIRIADTSTSSQLTWSQKWPIIFCRGHEAIGCDRTDSVLSFFPAATLRSGADPSECSASLYDKALAHEGAFAKHVYTR
jgi:hypothetical protein